MEISVKRRGRPPEDKGQKMSVLERETLLDQNKDREFQLKDPSASHMVQDRGTLQREFERTKNLLEKDEDLEAKGKEKDRLVARNKEIATELEKRVPPLWLQKARPGTPDYAKAIEAGIKANEPIVGKLYAEYKSNALKIDPQNPSAGNIVEIISK